jgi:hypothetical protein
MPPSMDLALGRFPALYSFTAEMIILPVFCWAKAAVDRNRVKIAIYMIRVILIQKMHRKHTKITLYFGKNAELWENCIQNATLQARSASFWGTRRFVLHKGPDILNGGRNL